MKYWNKGSTRIIGTIIAILVITTGFFPFIRPAQTGNITAPTFYPANQATIHANSPLTGNKSAVTWDDSLTPESIRFAVIGDYGDNSQAEADVAALVDGWNPDIVVTVGDNNYSLGAASTIDGNIGQYYRQYIYPYTGSYGAGATVNRFFPALGNHDMNTDLGQPYVDYFSLPGNERYYDFVQGPIHFFIINSDPREPDGVSSSSVQGQWLQNKLSTSSSAWQVTVFHHAAYTSATHGSSMYMRWPFKEWGVDAVLTGHDHTYERLLVDGIPYFVDGLGGHSAYNFETILPESQVRYNASPGAMLVEGDANQLVFNFYSRTSVMIDSFTLVNTTTPQKFFYYIPSIHSE